MLVALFAACAGDKEASPPLTTGTTDTAASETGDTAPSPAGSTGDTGPPADTGDTGAVPIPSLCTVASPHRITAADGFFAGPVIGPDRDGDGCGDVWFTTGDAWRADQGQPTHLAQPTFTGVYYALAPTTGGVWAVTLSDTFWVTKVPVAPTDPATVAAGGIAGVAGDAILPIGDLDGDGLEDLIVSDTELDTVGWWTAPFDRTQTTTDALASWSGIAHVSGGSRAELHPAGDLTGDGLPDLLVGAPWAEHVYLLSDPPRAPGSLGDAALAWATTPYAVESHLGSGLGAGDLDGDGALEWVVQDEFVGEVYAVPGAAVGEVDLTTAAITLTWNEENVEGGDIGVGDLDGDGDDDLALGAPWRGGYYSNRGEVLVLYGPVATGVTDLEAAAVVVTGGDPDRVMFGRQLTVGELDPDPGLELIVGGQVGDPSSYTGGADEPAVWIFQDL